MSPGEAIDYLRGGANRRVTTQVSGAPTMFRWRHTGLESCVGGKWSGAFSLPHFAEYSYEKTREMPRAPSGTHWGDAFKVSDGVTLEVDNRPIEYHPIASDQERDIQAARVAEHDTRPEAEE